MFFMQAPLMAQQFIPYAGTNYPKSRKTRFTHEEDEKLKELVAKYGDNDWPTIAQNMKNRNVRQCRERWRNYMNPTLSKELWSEEEDKKLLERYHAIGAHWNTIKQSFPDRSINAVRNRIIRLLGLHPNRQKPSTHAPLDVSQTVTPKPPTTPDIVEKTEVDSPKSTKQDNADIDIFEGALDCDLDLF